MRLVLLVLTYLLATFSPAAASPGADTQSTSMKSSDHWGMYFSSMGGHVAMTVFDDGISKRLEAVELPNSIKVKLYLDSVREDGLPTTEEGERLMEIGPIIENSISDNGGLFLGRVTTNSLRWNLGLAPGDTSAIESALVKGSEDYDFRYELYVEPDPNKLVYWEDLNPTDDDRQVMADMDVKQALADNGDNQYAERPVEHWSYFDRKGDAKKYADWAEQQGYLSVSVSRQKDGLLAPTRWLVRFNHRGTMVLNDITHHTIKLSNQARKNGGAYDGWETQVTE